MKLSFLLYSLQIDLSILFIWISVTSFQYFLNLANISFLLVPFKFICFFSISSSAGSSIVPLMLSQLSYLAPSDEP